MIVSIVVVVVVVVARTVQGSKLASASDIPEYSDPCLLKTVKHGSGRLVCVTVGGCCVSSDLNVLFEL